MKYFSEHTVAMIEFPTPISKLMDVNNAKSQLTKHYPSFMLWLTITSTIVLQYKRKHYIHYQVFTQHDSSWMIITSLSKLKALVNSTKLNSILLGMRRLCTSDYLSDSDLPSCIATWAHELYPPPHHPRRFIMFAYRIRLPQLRSHRSVPRPPRDTTSP